jgi:hemolysin III
MTGPPTVALAALDPLYDSRRDRYYRKPRWRGWSHLVGFEVSLVVGTLMIVAAHGAVAVAAASIYGASVAAMFGTSALYHRGNWGPLTGPLLQRADHGMIFLLIAGTATPAFAVAARGTYGIVCLAVLWVLAIIASVIHLVWMSAPEVIVGATYIGLGSMGALALPSVWVHGGVAPALLLLSGGFLYIVGAVLYHRRQPDPFPSVFGYHEVFHACVCAAAACQYVAIALFLV